MIEERRNRSRAVFASFVGTVLEWYDFFVYGTAAALVFPRAFFPKVDPFASVLASLAVFGVGFLARPLGGALFAHIGDRFGRKRSLAATLTVMGCATLSIGLLPGYSSIGLAAPCLLVVLRMIQGIALGGEYGAAVLFVTENVPSKQIGFFGSWTQAGVPAGMLLSSAAFAVSGAFAHQNLESVGWRIPFFIGGCVAFAGVYVRRRLLETAEFSRVSPVRSPLTQVFARSRREIIGAILIRLPENASYYLATVFLISFGATHGGLDRKFLVDCLLIGSSIQFISILVFGRLCDRVGTRIVILLGLLLITPCFLFLANTIGSADRGLLLLAFPVFLGIGHALLYAPQSAFFAQLFPVEIRYSGVSAVTQLSAVLAGGVAPFVGAYLTRGSHLGYLVAYVAALSFLGLVGWVIVGKRSVDQSLKEVGPRDELNRISV